MALAILMYCAILFVLEVLVGSSTGVYNAEIGSEATFDHVTKLSLKHFCFQLLPMIILLSGGFYYLSEINRVVCTL